jgi:parvulin-like peptidyl-prolyl isomerase
MPSSTLRKFAILLVLALTILACRKTPESASESKADAIATIGNRAVSIDDFKRYLELNAGTALEQIAPEASSALLDQFIEETLLAEYSAKTLGDVPASEIAAEVGRSPGSTASEKRDVLRRQKLMIHLQSKLTDPSAQEIEAIYNQSRDDFQLDERVRVRQILLRDEASVDAIFDRLRRGEKFEDLSMEFSAAANAKQGGDIGYISRGQLPRTFEDVIFALRPGEVSRVIKTESSWHIFKVDEKQPAGPVPLETATPLIRQRINDEQMRKEVSAVVEAAQKTDPVEVRASRLPFAYSGTYPVAGE